MNSGTTLKAYILFLVLIGLLVFGIIDSQKHSTPDEKPSDQIYSILVK